MAVTPIDKIVSAVNRIGERTYDQRQANKQSSNQRRNTFVDIYGLDIARQGDTNNHACFGVSISPDLIYYERWEFKIDIRPFAMPVAGGGTTDSVNATVANTSLTTNGTTITPNPHGHATAPHSHNLTAGISIIPSTISNFEVFIGTPEMSDADMINLTEHLKAQHPGEWPSGQGLFPSGELDKFDILKAVGRLHDWQKGAVLTSGYKIIQFRANGVFNASLVNYLKYSAVNR